MKGADLLNGGKAELIIRTWSLLLRIIQRSQSKRHLTANKR
jgi:hypothetical protein